MEVDDAVVNIVYCGPNSSATDVRRLGEDFYIDVFLRFDVTIFEETNFPDVIKFEERVIPAQEKLKSSISSNAFVESLTALLIFVNYISFDEAIEIAIDTDSFTVSNVNFELLNSKAPTSAPSAPPSEAPYDIQSNLYFDRSMIIFLSIFIPLVVCTGCSILVYMYVNKKPKEAEGTFEDIYGGNNVEIAHGSVHSIDSNHDTLHLMELAEANGEYDADLAASNAENDPVVYIDELDNDSPMLL